MSERLQKFLARAGVASRRHAEVLITAGRVSVNNQRVTELGSKVEPSDLVMVDGQLVTVPEHTSWYLLHKPPGVVTTLSDPEGRPTVAGLLEGVEERVFPVGRLDWDAEGALLLTNDGGVAHRLLHPSFEVPRTYLVKVKGTPTDETLARLREGVRLEDGPARALRAERFEATERNTWLILQVGEGRPHLVKRLCAAVGHPVVRLFRPGQAGVSVAGLQPGQLRPLTTEEVQRVEAIAAGGTVPEPAPFLPPRRHGRAGEDDEVLDGGEMPSTADTAAREGVGRASTGRAGGPGGRSGGFETQGRDARNGRGGKPRFGRPGRDAERPGAAGRPWRGAADDGDRFRGDGKRRGRDTGPGESGARPPRGASGPSRGGFGARASRGAGVSERFPPGGRERDRGFGDRAPRETGASEGDFRPRGRGAPRAGFGGRPSRGPGEGASRPRGGGFERTGFGNRPTGGTGEGESGFRPRGRGPPRGPSGGGPSRGGTGGDFRPRGRGAPRAGFGSRSSRGPGEGASRPPGRGFERAGFGDRPPRDTGANEGEFRPRGRGAPRAGFGGRPSRGPGEAESRPRGRGFERTNFGDRPTGGTDTGESGFQPRVRGPPRGRSAGRPSRGGTGGDFRPRGRGSPRAGFGGRPSRGPGEGETRPRGRGFERTGFGGRPAGGTDAGESGFRPRGRGPPRGGSGPRPARAPGASTGRFPPRGRAGFEGGFRPRGPGAGAPRSARPGGASFGRSAPGPGGNPRGKGRFGALPRGGGAGRPRPGPRGGGGGGRGGGRR